MLGIFVTGTDTGVGKTVVSSVVVAALRKSCEVGYWKPVQTGIEVDDDTAEVRRLASCVNSEIGSEGIRLPRPLSPHLAARLAGRPFAISDLTELWQRLPARRFWIVEGAGGLLVPLNDRETMADLIGALALPALIASRSGLGTINHTLLTLAELRRRSIPVQGVVMVGEPNMENRAAIEGYGETRVLVDLPIINPLDEASIEAQAQRASPALRSLLAPADETGRSDQPPTGRRG